MNKGLVVNRGQQHWSTAHLFSLTANSTLLCQATLQPAGSNLQLQHLSRINSSAPTLRSQQVHEGEVQGTHWCLWTRLGSRDKGKEGVLLIYCCADFCSLYVEIGDSYRVMVLQNDADQYMTHIHTHTQKKNKKNNGARITAFTNE